MQRVLVVTVGAVCFSGLGLISSAQSQQPPGAPAYANRCASCHGSDMTGPAAPSILSWVDAGRLRNPLRSFCPSAVLLRTPGREESAV